MLNAIVKFLPRQPRPPRIHIDRIECVDTNPNNGTELRCGWLLKDMNTKKWSYTPLPDAITHLQTGNTINRKIDSLNDGSTNPEHKETWQDGKGCIERNDQKV